MGLEDDKETRLVFQNIIVHSLLQIMDAIKGTMTEIYNDLSKSTSGNTIAEVGVFACKYYSDHNVCFACDALFTLMGF